MNYGSTEDPELTRICPSLSGARSAGSVSQLFCVDFKPDLRNFVPGVDEKSAVKLRDF
jgi:hypothetical protein